MTRPPGVPAPSADATKKLTPWQDDLWFKIVKCALGGDVHDMTYDYHPALRRPALSRYVATSPECLRWFKGWNEEKASLQAVATVVEGLTPTAVPRVNSHRRS